MLLSDYITKIENKEKVNNNKTTKSHIKFKRWAYISTVVAIIEGFILFSA